MGFIIHCESDRVTSSWNDVLAIMLTGQFSRTRTKRDIYPV